MWSSSQSSQHTTATTTNAATTTNSKFYDSHHHSPINKKCKTQETPSSPPQTLVPVKEENEEKVETEKREGGREGGRPLRKVEGMLGLLSQELTVGPPPWTKRRSLIIEAWRSADFMVATPYFTTTVLPSNLRNRMMNLSQDHRHRATPDTRSSHSCSRRVDGPDWRTTGSVEPQASIHPQRDPFGSESRGGLHWVSEGRVFEDGGAVRAAVGGVGGVAAGGVGGAAAGGVGRVGDKSGFVIFCGKYFHPTYACPYYPRYGNHRGSSDASPQPDFYMSRPSPRIPQQERRTIEDIEKNMISNWLSPSTNSVEVNEFTPVEDYWSEPEETLVVSLHEPYIEIAQNEADEVEKEIEIISERSKEP
ncbi:hypothetical protein Sjap_018761 [Stephania japonica]|uniref:Uncharacterized protein n=1 Tax=Stephania japonica TaxID=461633 RepID=A0AAP0I9D1_9MAGN